MDFINSLSPARKKSLLAAAILLIIALVIAGFLRLTGSSETDMAASAASSAQSTEEDPQSDIPQSVAKTITPQSGGPRTNPVRWPRTPRPPDRPPSS